MRACRVLLSALSFAVLALAAPHADALPLAAHRAVYDLSLARATDKSGVTGVSGRMVYEFNGSPCEGYTVRFRFVTQIDSDDGSKLTDQRTTTYEDAGGRTFSFVTKTYVDQNLEKEVRGTATRTEDGTTVKLEKPQPRTLKLQQSQFPTAHLLDMLARARQGVVFYQTTIFDGSEDANRVMDTSVVIGKPKKPDKSDPEYRALSSLKNDTYWPVEMAYFDPRKKTEDGLPSYRIAFKLQGDGVTRDLLMDYGDFAMRAKLVNLTLFPQSGETCKR